MVRVSRVVGVLAAAALAGAAMLTGSAALAGTQVDQAVSSLQNDPVYQSADAQLTLTDAQLGALRDKVAALDTKMFVAILPASAATEEGSTASVLRAVHDGVGEQGTYAVVVGSQFEAGSDLTSVRDVATRDFSEHRAQGVNAVLTAFVADAGALVDAAGGSSAASPATGSSDGSPDSVFTQTSSSGPGIGVLAPLVLIGGGGLALVTVLGLAARRNRRPRWTQEEWLAARSAAEEDVTRLGEEVSGLDVHVDDAELDPAAREHYSGALDAYDHAKQALAAATSPDDLGPVTQAVGDGRWQLQCVRAVLAHAALPERRPPCFFNPQHGPSTSDVQWAPPGGAPRTVPVCAADAERLAAGSEPESRQVLVGGQRRPYWDAGPAFGGWAGGYYNAWGGILPALLIGTALGGGFGGFGWGGGDQTTIINNDWSGGGGDFGGGGFGGGDFGGGGGFGGGDFGGGDFGGGGGDFGGN